MAVKIDAHIHKAVLKRLEEEYRLEFGVDVTDTRMVRLTREEQAQTYARNLHFWRQRLPVIDPQKALPNMETVAQHAICTNAELGLKKYVKTAGIEESVMRILEGLEA